jgi:hypothetical protein
MIYIRLPAACCIYIKSKYYKVIILYKVQNSSPVTIRRPSGIIAGLTAAWAIFGLFLAIDHELGLPPGSLYKMVGLAFGIDSSYAVYFGFTLYMVTAVIIGIIYSTISKRFKILYINSLIKGLGTGVLAGVIVWAVLFLPINYLVMQPILQNLLNTASPTSEEYNLAKQFAQVSNTIFFGSLALHVVFGGVMGFCARLAVANTSVVHD